MFNKLDLNINSLDKLELRLIRFVSTFSNSGKKFV